MLILESGRGSRSPSYELVDTEERAIPAAEPPLLEASDEHRKILTSLSSIASSSKLRLVSNYGLTIDISLISTFYFRTGSNWCCMAYS
jgi:hypothetical protein